MTEMKLYGARNTLTGKLVCDITNPGKRFWQQKMAARRAIWDATHGIHPKYNSLELVTFKLVEIKEE